MKIGKETIMEYKNIAVDQKGEIAFLILSRPEVGNRLGQESFTEICQTLKALNADGAVRVIIVKGAGENFCVGADVTEIAKLDEVGRRSFFSGLNEMYKTFHRMDKVTIVMVNGYATAAGLGIPLSCDLVVASEDAQFGATGVKVGLFCMTASAVLLPAIVGSKKALEMGLTGDLISAKEAERLGIVNIVVPRERLESATMELAQKILSKNPVSIVLGKRNFYACAELGFDKGLDYSVEMYSVLTATREAREGMSAFLEKREPHWEMEEK